MSNIRAVKLGNNKAILEKQDDGSYLVQSKMVLPEYARCLTDRLDYWAEKTPDSVLFADRPDGGDWRKISYTEVAKVTRSLGQFLLNQGLSVERPLIILAPNSIEHSLLGLAAMRVGIPYSPVSLPYALVSRDYAKLQHVFKLLTPGLVYVPDYAAFEPALNVVAAGLPVLAMEGPQQVLNWQDALSTEAGSEQQAAEAAITPDTIAKFLFTSGSTGMPKAVINTQRMLCSNQVMIREILAFAKEEPPVMVDWMPWNHTAGGNHNFGLVLYNGGTMYIDGGKPTPQGIDETVRNLSEVSPTWYSNVPKGYEMLVERMKDNPALAKSFFSRLKQVQYAGASLAKHVWDGLVEQANAATGETVMIITGYGSTETAPFASTTTWPVERPGEIGLPAAGLTFKLVPNAQKLELRLKGESITPGYWRMPEKTAESFDEDGFYKIGDALKFVDEDDINKGFLFDGRVSEDFKLSTGTWVNFAAVRTGLVKACAPLIRDAVLTGLDRNYIGALMLLDIDAAGRAVNLPEARETELAANAELRAMLQKRLQALSEQSTGSSNTVVRAMIVPTPLSLDKGEITDKGSTNQGAVLSARADMVATLYAEPTHERVLVVA